jgi:hypothetical protein
MIKLNSKKLPLFFLIKPDFGFIPAEMLFLQKSFLNKIFE